ncbi:hypothetical protein Tco_0875274 [Tanacetum coccineum]|uniref:Uncharacterized protein n=1 Tax=Tanacetum coccineum TaxID=301880 RepID=A0ABQ5BPR5_9ASTR
MGDYGKPFMSSVPGIDKATLKACKRLGAARNKVGFNYARGLTNIRVDRELKENMVIVIPNLEGKGDVLHTIRVKSVVNDDVLGAHGESFIGADYVVENGQKANADDIYMGDLRNSYDALKEMENIILNVITSCAEKVCNIVNDSEKVVDESESPTDDIYDETP